MSSKRDDHIVSGGVHIGGGSHVRAQNISGGNMTITTQSVNASQLFRPVEDAIKQAQQPNKSEALQQLETLEHEVAKGEHADHRVMTQLLDGIIGLVPDAIKSLAEAFGSPILAGVSGPATKHLLNKLLNP